MNKVRVSKSNEQMRERASVKKVNYDVLNEARTQKNWERSRCERHSIRVKSMEDWVQLENEKDREREGSRMSTTVINIQTNKNGWPTLSKGANKKYE